MFKVTVDKEKCVGCGSCVAVCKTFEIGKDGKAYTKSEKLEEAGCITEAKDICPVQAIEIEEV